MTIGGGLTFSQNFSCLALTVWVIPCIEDIFTKGDSLTHSLTLTVSVLINDKGVCRTAPATPGLLMTVQCTLHLLQARGPLLLPAAQLQ